MVYGSPQIYDYIKTIFIHVPKTAGTSMENILKEKPTDKCGGHSTAWGMKCHKDYKDIFEKYYKFAFVRHPYYRYVSAYFYLKGWEYHPALNNQDIIDSKDIEDFTQNYFLNRNIVHFLPQFKFVCDPKYRVIVDDIFKFENLDEDWEYLNDKIGLNLELPLKNKSKYSEFSLSQDSISIINEYYKKDFELFGYEVKSTYI